jgi:hypothetical protein
MSRRFRLVSWLFFGSIGLLLAPACNDEAASPVDVVQAGADTQVTVDTAAPTDTADVAVGSTYCLACTADTDCGADARCIPDSAGATYCAPLCLLSKNDCGPGSTCRPYGTGTDEFACQPDYGRCTGAGEPCAPCATNDDCETGSDCLESKMDKVKSCYPRCETDATCPPEWGCTDGHCLPFVANKHRQACNTRASSLCEPCSFDYDCKEGLICGPKLGYCTEKCTKEAGLDNSCPAGLFCPSGYCEPPVLYKCQGWLGCASGCPDGTTCDKGFCK